MARIFWDTNLFIYLFEQNPDWLPQVVRHRERMLARGDVLLTSWLTVGEILTKPKAVGNTILEKAYKNFFESDAVQVIPFEAYAAERFAEVRSQYAVRPADAIQLACASAARTDLFVTNNSRLANIVVDGITFLSRLENVP